MQERGENRKFREGAYCIYLGHSTIDHTSPSTRSTVLTPIIDTSNVWALITYFHIFHGFFLSLILSFSCLTFCGDLRGGANATRLFACVGLKRRQG